MTYTKTDSPKQTFLAITDGVDEPDGRLDGWGCTQTGVQLWVGEREEGVGGGIFMTLINQIFDTKSTMVSLHMV